MINFTEKRTIIANTQTKNNTSLDINSFLSLFVEDGPFSLLTKDIFGITPLNAQAKSFAISFKEENATKITKQLIAEFGQGQTVLSKQKIPIKITFSWPKPPPQTITLWPVSHEIPPQTLSDMVAHGKWGKLNRFSFGRHKNFPQFHNAYLHLQIDQINIKNIPEKITINNQAVMVLKPGEFSIARCNFCKTKGHTVGTCPNKTRTSAMAKTSYASAVAQSSSRQANAPTAETNNEMTRDSPTRDEESPKDSPSSAQPPDTISIPEPIGEENQQQGKLETKKPNPSPSHPPPPSVTDTPDVDTQKDHDEEEEETDTPKDQEEEEEEEEETDTPKDHEEEKETLSDSSSKTAEPLLHLFTPQHKPKTNKHLKRAKNTNRHNASPNKTKTKHSHRPSKH